MSSTTLFPSGSSTVDYLRTLPAIRDRCSQIFALSLHDQLQYITFNPSAEAKVVKYCLDIIRRDFGNNLSSIPGHGRKNHFITPKTDTCEVIDRIEKLCALPEFPEDSLEKTKSLIDLYFVSVLLDAGAGNTWVYEEVDYTSSNTTIADNDSGKKTGWVGGRSEGLAVASFGIFTRGFYSSNPDKPYQVDADALSALTTQKIGKYMQVHEGNQMDGLEGRTGLLVQLGKAMKAMKDVYPSGRPGDMLDYFISRGLVINKNLPIEALWSTLIQTLMSVWPARLTIDGHALGDVWRCEALTKHLESQGKKREPGDDLVPFHKLSQWLCYSLIEPIENVAGWKVDGWKEKMTGLPEYRNGGLLVDLELLSLKPDVLDSSYYPNGHSRPPVLKPDHPAIIEWRAMTVICLDRIAAALRKSLGDDSLTLAQVLEAATWKGGREIAKEKRGSLGGGPPIEIVSDGTVF